MKTLAIDVETYSSTDLLKSGVYKYVEADDFTVLLIACSFDGEEPIVLDIESNPYQAYLGHFKDILTDPLVLKTAFNANFERTCLSKFFDMDLPAEQWECTMVKASMLGLPLSLDMVSKVLQLSEKKNAAGKALIRYFSCPCKPTKANEGRTRNLPEHAPDKWQDFIDYCRQDVKTELAIREKIKFFENNFSH
mgnify:CR=1 FL=1